MSTPELRPAYPVPAVEPGLPASPNSAPGAALLLPIVDGDGGVSTQRIIPNAGGSRLSLDGKRVNSVTVARPGTGQVYGNGGGNGNRADGEPTRAITAPPNRGELTQGLRLRGGHSDVTTSERALARVRSDTVPTGRASVDGAIGPLSWATRTPDDGPGFADRAMARVVDDPELERKSWIRAATGAATAALAKSRRALSKILGEDSSDLPTLRATATAVSTGSLVSSTRQAAGNTYGTPVGGPRKPGTTPPAVVGPAPPRVSARFSAPGITSRPETEPAPVAGPITVAWVEGSHEAAAATAAATPSEVAVSATPGDVTQGWFAETPSPTEATAALVQPAYEVPAATDTDLASLYARYHNAFTTGDEAARAGAWNAYRTLATQGRTDAERPPFADPAGIYYDRIRAHRGAASVPIGAALARNTVEATPAAATLATHGERTGVIRRTATGLPDRASVPAQVPGAELAPAVPDDVVDAEPMPMLGTPEYDKRMSVLNGRRIMLEDEIRHGISDPDRAAEVDRQLEAVLHETAAVMRGGNPDAAAGGAAEGEEEVVDEEAANRAHMQLLERVLSGLNRL